MRFYRVVSSHWDGKEYEFASEILMKEGDCFRISSFRAPEGKRHKAHRYPTRFKVKSVSDVQTYEGEVVEILTADLTVKDF